MGGHSRANDSKKSMVTAVKLDYINYITDAQQAAGSAILLMLLDPTHFSSSLSSTWEKKLM